VTCINFYGEGVWLLELVTDLRRVPPLERTARDVGRLLAAAAAKPHLTPRLPSRPGSYTRTCAYSDDRFEVLLLNWWADAASEIHDHGGQHCWLVVLEGRLRVDDYVRVDAGDIAGKAVLESVGSRQLGSGDLDVRSGRYDVHRVAAAGARGHAARVLAPLTRVSRVRPHRAALPAGPRGL
jgi:hypothetical protein